MSGIVRLTLVSHGMTEAMSSGRFPGDEPLSDLGRRQLAGHPGPYDRAVCGPELRCRQSAECLGVQAETDVALADLDAGRWRGLSLGELSDDQVSRWLTDTDAADHGGESVGEVLARVGDWMAALTTRPGRVLAVSSPAVIRAAVVAALQAPPISFWRIDIAPASSTVLHWRGAWTLRMR